VAALWALKRALLEAFPRMHKSVTCRFQNYLYGHQKSLTGVARAALIEQ
jgi:hypothetical protein